MGDIKEVSKGVDWDSMFDYFVEDDAASGRVEVAYNTFKDNSYDPLDLDLEPEYGGGLTLAHEILVKPKKGFFCKLEEIINGASEALEGVLEPSALRLEHYLAQGDGHTDGVFEYDASLSTLGSVRVRVTESCLMICRTDSQGNASPFALDELQANKLSKTLALACGRYVREYKEAA